MVSKQGVIVRYCGHDAVFVADVSFIAGVAVVRANGKIEAMLYRGAFAPRATMHVVDYPDPGFWRPDIGVLVVPREQLTEVAP